MKKQLVAAVLASVTLAAAAPAFAAANPFVDVPAKHWAYEAVTKLAAAGIVDGYGDGTFRGDKTMTRYEMAQIVAKALAKSDKMSASDKALADKLAAEFGDELKNLGVRVAALEAQQGSVKWGGDLTIRNYEFDKADDNDTTFEFRLTADAKVNDKTTVKARITSNEFDIVDNAGEDVTLDNIYVASKLGSVDVLAGRFDAKLGKGLIYDDTLNGVVFAKGKFLAGIGRQAYPYAVGSPAVDFEYDVAIAAVKDIKVGAADLGINYAKVSPVGAAENINVWAADLAFDLGKLGFTAQYAKSDADQDPDAIRLDVKLGSSPVTVGYQRVEANSVTPHSAYTWPHGFADYTGRSTILDEAGIKGWDITYSKDVAKNTAFSLKYADLENVADSTIEEKVILTTLQFKF